jgi:hypothetical protein
LPCYHKIPLAKKKLRHTTYFNSVLIINSQNVNSFKIKAWDKEAS